MKPFLVSTKKPGLEFEILKRQIVDAEKQEMTLTLIGANKVKFDRTVNPEILAKYGYEVQLRPDPEPV